MNMVEKIARAIAQADEQNGGPPYDMRIGMGKHAKAHLFDQARAVIQAMREPTEEMKAGEDTYWDYSCHVCGGLKEGWQTMIDAALAE